GDWFSFAKRGDPAPVCMEVAKSGLKLWKDNFFLIDCRAIPFHMPWRHPGSCITDKVPTSFNQNHIDQLKANIVKLHDILKGVLVRFGLSRVWRNLMCDPVLRRSDNTVMSIYDFLCMPSLDKLMVREEPHGLDTSILGRVVDRTTLPAPAGTAFPHAFLEEIAVTLPDHKRDGSEFAMEDVIYPPILLPDKEVKAHAELSEGVRRATRASFSEDASPYAQEAALAPDAQPLDADAVADEIASDGNVDPYYEAQVGNTVGDVLERDLLPIVPVPYYIFYPYAEGSGSKPPPYTKDDWEEIHRVNLGLQKKELYKDPRVCRTAIDRFLTPVKTHWLRELSSAELSDCMSVLQCQLITHRSMLNARYDHSLRNVERLSKQCAQQTQTIKRQSADLKRKNESSIHANEEVSRKYGSERDALVIEKAKIEEELIKTKS
ncbi:hypothetical protein Tco_0844819, partial [Tanacetum coccineum]